MKLSFLLFFVSTLTIMASTSYSQETKLSLSLENVRIKDLLQEIKKQSDFSFWYNNNELNDDRRVTLEVKDQTIDKILEVALKNQDLNYEIKDKFILIYKRGINQNATVKQQLKITGIVTDAFTGETLPGVNIVVEGTGIGVTSDINGKYNIELSNPEAYLIFSYVGYLSERIQTEGRSVIDIALAMDVKKLDEVVVVGYGSMRRKDVTSSITTITSQEFNTGAHTNVMQLLQGKVPGLNITKDGNPNGSTAIILRGQSTLRTGGAQEPLYVVDGVPGGIISSMDDIVSMDVLRDASAAAIYGSRAANGVIIVTTRRGEENNSKISYNAYVGVETISNKIDMMSASEYRSFLSENDLILDPVDEDGVDTDWLKEVTRTGISHSNNLSIGGGNNKTTYFGSATYKKVDGIIKETGVKSLSMTANVQQKAIKDRLTLGFTITTGISDSKLLPTVNDDTQDFLLNMINYIPTVAIRDSDGNFKEHISHPGARNPVALLEQNTDNKRSKDFMGTAHLQFNILKGLDYEINVSYQNSQANRGIYYGKESKLAIDYNGVALRSTYENEKKLLETYTTYNKILNNHDFKVLVGYSWQEDCTGNGFTSSNTDFVSDETGYNNMELGNGGHDLFLSSYEQFLPSMGTLRMISGYARLNYSFNSKYLLQATIRRDGSSAFGENNRWGNFPSVSLGWRITEESFMKSQDVFDNLKLRATYGISGNSLGFDPLISLLRYGTSGNFYYNGVYINAIKPTQNANPDLKWERTIMSNIGLDFSVLKSRISGTIEYYDKITKDLVYWYPVSATEYYVTSYITNVGELENKGWEFTLNANPVKTHNLAWNTTFIISSNKNNLNKLSNDKFSLDFINQAGVGEHGQSGNYAQRIKEGYPIGQFYLWKYAGHNEDGQSQFYKADGTLTTTPGSEDHFYVGNAQPKATGSWNNMITYKNISLDFLFRGVAGNKIMNATRADLNYPAEATHYNMPRMTWDEPINDNGASYSSTRYLEKGDYLRLDNVTLAYTFKLKNPLIKNLRVYSTANNVFVITGYKGLDPEVNMGGITPGVDNQNFYPKTRSFIFGVNVDF